MGKFNNAGRALIKGEETCVLHVYQDAGGVWTIGWGHTNGVTKDTPPCTQEQADAWLEDDLQDAINTLDNFLDVDLNDNQYSAMVSLVYNAGTKPLRGHLGTYLNDARFVDAAGEFGKWVFAGGHRLEGLIERRKLEKALFEKPVSGGESC